MKKGPMGALSLLKGLKVKDLAPEAPAIANYTTGEVMGHSADRLAARFGVSREDQDLYAVRSHHNAARAHEQGLYKDEVIPVDGEIFENNIKADTNMEKVRFCAVENTHRKWLHASSSCSVLLPTPASAH